MTNTAVRRCYPPAPMPRPQSHRHSPDLHTAPPATGNCFRLPTALQVAPRWSAIEIKLVSHFLCGFMADRDIQCGSGNGSCGFHDVAVAVVRFLDHRFSVGFCPGGDFIHLPEDILQDGLSGISTVATSIALSGSVVVLTA